MSLCKDIHVSLPLGSSVALPLMEVSSVDRPFAVILGVRSKPLSCDSDGAVVPRITSFDEAVAIWIRRFQVRPLRPLGQLKREGRSERQSGYLQQLRER